MPNPTDHLYLRLLVLRAQTGDRAAFAQLVAAHDPRLRAFLHKMLPAARRHLDDLAQDVWLDALRALPQLTTPESFRPWLYRIARNRLYRTLRRRPPTPLPLDDHEPPAADDAPDFTPDDAAAVHAALDQLPPEHRETLLLRFIEDMSYDDIAAATNVPLGTVRSRLHHAKRALRQIIESQNNAADTS